MSKVLAILLWPAGIALICCVGAALARRALQSPVATPGALLPGPPERSGSGAPAGPGDGGARAQVRNVTRFLLLVAAGTALIYAVMIGLAWLAEHFGPVTDRRIFYWTTSHQIPAWKHLMEVATQVGDKYPTAAVAVVAAIILAAAWRGNRWLPAVALVSLVVIAHYLTIAIDLTIQRPPPPGSHGTFPSGGAARAVAVYGLVAYLAWRRFSGRRKAAVWLAVVVAVLSFNEAYSRGYLAVHWFTDILGGLGYGCLLLGLFVAAVRAVAGPVRAGWTPGIGPVRPGRPFRRRRPSTSTPVKHWPRPTAHRNVGRPKVTMASYEPRL